MGALNVIEPTLKPRATEHIGGMIKMIERLVDTGYAYVVDGHVLFDTTKYPQGVLTGQTEGRDHARIDEASRSEEHTSELQSLMRLPYAVFCLKKKNQTQEHSKHPTTKRTHHT